MIAANLLGRGRASINRWNHIGNSDPLAPSVVKMYVKTTRNGEVAARMFCTTDNASLLTVFYVVD
jgi:hypothetical protein